MFRLLANFFCGYVWVRVVREKRAWIYQMMFAAGIEFYGEKNKKDGTLCFNLPIRYLDAFRSFCNCKDGGEGIFLSDLRGVPLALRFLKRRPGMLIGFVVLLVWTVFSQHIVWDVRVEGNTKTPESDIVDALAEAGCAIGDWIPSIDFDDVHARYLASSGEISWISVYMNGVVAEVQVIEMIHPTRTTPPEGTYANVVAAEDGVIESVRVFEGQSAVKAGDVVRAGEVVISGVMERKDEVARYEYASGEVLARTVRRIDVKIARVREEKAYTGRETVRKSIKIFGNVVNLFQKTGIAYEKYDKIDTRNRLTLFGICPLPIWIDKTVYREYGYEEREVSAEQAVAEGLAELRHFTDEAIEGGELLDREISTDLAEDGYTIQCLLYCLRDIAQTAEFTIKEYRE